MRIFTVLSLFSLAIFVVYYIAGDNAYDEGQAKECTCTHPSPENATNSEGLLASRFDNLEQLKSVIQIEYMPSSNSKPSSDAYSKVCLKHCTHGKEVSSELETGISQGDIMSVLSGGIPDKIWLLLKSPFSVANRMDLIKIFSLSRRKPQVFGEGDVAFYDLAETMVAHINTPNLAFQNPRDSSEKGFINSFNHLTAQAFITSCFSEEMADFLSDVHELKTMPELTHGHFTNEQLNDPNTNPVDNYVDMINNEWGQEVGKKLKEKYQIHNETIWTPKLLTNYLNDIQSYYSWSFQIGFEPYQKEDDLIIKFVTKINIIMQGKMPM